MLRLERARGIQFAIGTNSCEMRNSGRTALRPPATHLLHLLRASAGGTERNFVRRGTARATADVHFPLWLHLEAKLEHNLTPQPALDFLQP